ncbi:hypothetical protein [Aerococcus christensenii]|uniref:hypothetical protein n=1 Tax=Aerococcus christensenii TaxID=87541 RepID=UPI0021539EFD|nr:hypothetical protein [Aerococcus christensenii]
MVYVGKLELIQGWVNEVASGAKSGITFMDGLGLILISFILPAILSPLFRRLLEPIGWIKEGDLTLG